MKSKNKKVSIIIPFYNYAVWLDEALDSVVKQTYDNIEIIVVNDGSKEDISYIEKKYKDKVMFFKKKNGGAASARNLGLKQCTGEYVAFLDSDDIWLENKLEKQIDELELTGKEWCVTSYQSFPTKKEKIVSPYVGKANLSDILYNSCMIQTSTILIKKNILLNNNIFFPEIMRKGQDIYVWFRLISKYDYCAIHEPLTLFRLRDNNSFMSAANHITTRAILWEKMNDNKDPLSLPKRKLTIIGYKLCYFIYKYNKKLIKNDSKFLKVLYFFPWVIFRTDNFILKRK